MKSLQEKKTTINCNNFKFKNYSSVQLFLAITSFKNYIFDNINFVFVHANLTLTFASERCEQLAARCSDLDLDLH